MLRTTLFLTVVCFSAPVVADDQQAPQTARLIATEILQVKVRNADGQPVADVHLIPWAIGSDQGHGWWQEELHGPPRPAVSDQNGIARLSYPRVHLRGARTTIVSVNAIHPDCCLETAHLDIPQGRSQETDQPRFATLTLRRGTKLRVAVVEGDNQALLPDVRLLLNGEVPPEYPEFVPQEDNWYVSRPLPPEWNWLRAVRLRDGAPPLFSAMFQWKPDDPDTHEIALSVEPGVRVEGRLDEMVPRPVHNGRIVACVTEPLTVPTVGSWWDVASVAADGTFVFDSLPKGGDVQLIAVCDGFASTSPPEELKVTADLKYGGRGIVPEIYRCPQFFVLDGDLIRPVVAMEPSGACRLRVLNGRGRPLEGTHVEFGPVEFFFGQGSLLFGNGYRSADVLRSGKYEIIGGKGFQQATDQQGWAEITNLPVGENRFRVLTPDRSDRFLIDGDEDDGRVTLSSGQITEQTVHVKLPPGATAGQK